MGKQWRAPCRKCRARPPRAPRASAGPGAAAPREELTWGLPWSLQGTWKSQAGQSSPRHTHTLGMALEKEGWGVAQVGRGAAPGEGEGGPGARPPSLDTDSDRDSVYWAPTLCWALFKVSPCLKGTKPRKQIIKFEVLVRAAKKTKWIMW